MESFSDFLLALSSREDSIFYFVLCLAAAVFIVAEILWFLRRPSAKTVRSELPADDTRFDRIWTVVPALVLALLALVSSERVSIPESTTAQVRKVEPDVKKVASSILPVAQPRQDFYDR